MFTSICINDLSQIEPFSFWLGAMFDHSAMGSRAALEYKIVQHNAHVDVEDKGRIKLKSKHSDKYLDMHDVYSTNTECRSIERERERERERFPILSKFRFHTLFLYAEYKIKER